MMVDFIDIYKVFRENNGLMWRVEPICEILSKEYGAKISPSTYYDFKSRGKSSRQIRDEYLTEKIMSIYNENYGVYGIRKMWHKLLNNGESVARCTVERLMKKEGISGAKRGKIKITTIAGKKSSSADLVNRFFHADEPNQLWVADFTYVSTWVGWGYTAFIVDVFARKIVGYKVSSQMSKEMVIGAYNMAVFSRAHSGHDNFKDLIHHSDKGSQYTAEDFEGLLLKTGVKASIGSVGDSYDNALAETINGAYKTELIKKFGPWKTIEQLNLETAKWVHWYNNERINEYCDYHSPNETEEVWYNERVDIRKISKTKK